VIKALKQQVSALQSRTSDLTAMKKEIAQLSRENTRLVNENEKLTESLESAQKESSALSTKLSAARASASSDNKAVPGRAEAARDAQLQKQKVEMYCDLTNLVVVGIKKNEDEEEVYDCLQTGRNGSQFISTLYAVWIRLLTQIYSFTFPLDGRRRDRFLRRHRVHLPAAAG
jgi:regulator of replication initiation timing